MMRIVPLNTSYRGFEIGYAVGIHGWLKACWRSSMETEWREGSIYVDGVEEIDPLVRQCIDYNYRIEATEAVLGRRLEMNELTPDL
jgi:hypothetical protein